MEISRVLLLAIACFLLATPATTQTCEPYGGRLSLGSNFVHEQSPERLVIQFNT